MLYKYVPQSALHLQNISAMEGCLSWMLTIERVCVCSLWHIMTILVFITFNYVSKTHVIKTFFIDKYYWQRHKKKEKKNKLNK